MFSVIDIIKALTIIVEDNFPDYPVNDKDIKEGFNRPSYFIDIDNVVNDSITAQFYRETVNYSLYFFALDIYKGFLDLLKIKNELMVLLSEPIEISKDIDGVSKTTHVVINSLTFEINNADKVLSCIFSTELIQRKPDRDEHEYIDTLVFEGVKVKTINEEE